MATEAQTAGDAQPVEVETTRPRARRRTRPVDYDEALAPTCMIWCMVAGLGFFIITILIWIAGAIGSLDWGTIF
jgi:hypothetical protein